MTHAVARRISSLLLVAVVAPVVSTSAQTAAYLREMPAPERVIADYRTDDEMTSRARQSAALFSLMSVMRMLARQRGPNEVFPNAEERPIWDAYGREANRLRSEGRGRLSAQGGLDSPRARWTLSVEGLQQNRAFQQELLNRYFSPQFRAQYRAVENAYAGQVAQGREMIDSGLGDLRGESDGTWGRMTEQEQQGALLFGGLMLALLGVGLFRELLPFDITGRGTPSIRAGFMRAKLHSFTGVVTDYQAVDHSRTTYWERRHATGHTETFSTTDISRHEEFDLVHEDQRHHVHTSHATYSGVQGGEFSQFVNQSVTAVWATRRWRQSGPYILFRQPTALHDIAAATAQRGIETFLAPRWWTILPAMGLGFALGSSSDILDGVLSGTSSSLRGVVMTVLAAAVWVVVYIVGSSIRTRRFDKHEMPRLRTLVDEATTPRA